MKQLTLPLFTPRTHTFDNLVVHEGIEAAVAAVREVFRPKGTPVPIIFLHGPAGVGKTHIIRALAAHLREGGTTRACTIVEAESRGDTWKFPLLQKLASSPDDALEGPNAVAVDDVHLVGEEDAAALWTLCNKLARSRNPLLMASRVAAVHIFKDNPHLASRVTAGLVLALRMPEDDARLLILDKMARDRNVRLPEEVGRYLVTHKSRNIKELEGIIDLLDETSLELKRRITLPLVKLLESEGRL